MAHPVMFDDDDPLLLRLRSLCLAFPEARERISHGRPNFYARATFAVYGGSERVEVEGGRMRMARRDHAVLIKARDDERPALLADSRFFAPAYLASRGWVGLDFDSAEADWTEIAELVEDSYREVSGPRLTALLDSRGGG